MRASLSLRTRWRAAIHSMAQARTMLMVRERATRRQGTSTKEAVGA